MDARYPIGKFEAVANPTPDQRSEWIHDIETTPAKLREAVRDLTSLQWKTPYREGGWTVLQVVHHMPDSHMQAYTRFKLALTEDQPVIKPYAEDLWADLPDTHTVSPLTSLTLLEALHERWTVLLKSLSEEQWQRSFRHPELGLMTLLRTANLYSWHGRHHIAHVTAVRNKL